MALSGKFRFRKATFGTLVLQVEDVRKRWWSSHEQPTWRDAKATDLAATELRLLLDLGSGRPLVPLSRAAVSVHSNEPGRTEGAVPTVVEELPSASAAIH